MIKINLKEILKERKMTLKQLSDLSGVSSNTLSALQNQKNDSIHFPTLDKITSALNINVEDLIIKYDLNYEIMINIENFSLFKKSQCKLILKDIENSNNIEVFHLDFHIFQESIKTLKFYLLNIDLDDLVNITRNITDQSLKMKLEYDFTDFFEIISYLIFQEIIHENQINLDEVSSIMSYLLSSESTANKHLKNYVFSIKKSNIINDKYIVYKYNLNINFINNSIMIDSNSLEFNSLVFSKKIDNNKAYIIID